jgi:hypothetical protein
MEMTTASNRILRNLTVLAAFATACSLSACSTVETITNATEKLAKPEIESSEPEDEQNIRVKRNMIAIQDAAEAYAADHKGLYPKEVNDAFKSYFPGGDPRTNKPGKAPTNPFSTKAEWPSYGTVADIAQIRSEYPADMAPGAIEYQHTEDLRAYAIVGGGANAKALPMLHHGSQGTLVLSNATFGTAIPRHTSSKLVIANTDDFDKVAGISPLVGLEVKCALATDSDLEKLAGSENIEKLDLSKTGISGAGLTHLADLTGLRWLDLSDTNIDGSSLQSLSTIPHLQQLNLQRTPVDDQTLAELSSYRDLKELDLRDTRINEKYLTDLRNMPRLETLYLSGHISAENLPNLKTVPTKLLVIDHSDLTAEAVKELQQSLPKRQVKVQK